MTPTPEQQAEALLAELTVQEKIAFLHQHQPAVERLGLARYITGCEALHGVAWIGKATVFPQAVGLGATWDRELVRRVGEAVSTEVRAFSQDTVNALEDSGQFEKPPQVTLNVWAPVVNLLRDPRWGRNEEGYSEDPYATAEIATAYCGGLRGQHPTVWRTTPVLKHFLAYNIETDRDLVDVRVPERVLHEYELPAFRGPIEAGVVAGVMPGYNLTNGVPNHVHPLINDALRAWDADLAVVSDAQAPSNLVEREKFFATHPESHAAALKAGVDSYTENSADSAPTVERFTEAFDQGLITEADLDHAVRRLLLLRARTGEFAAAQDDPYAGIRADVIDSAEHRALAREAAEASIVLLHNQNGALPLPTGDRAPGRVAVIGHLGTRVLADWYSGTLPYSVSIADGLATAFSADGTEIVAADGADLVTLCAIDGPGASVEFGPFRHQDWGTSVQCPIQVHTLQSAADGKYLTLTGEGDREVTPSAATPDGWFVKELWEFEAVEGDVAAKEGEPFVLRSNAPHSRKYVRLDKDTGALLADAENPAEATRFRLEVTEHGINAAVEVAAGADRVVLVLGNDPHINGRETVDRDGIELPRAQDRLLRAVQAANPDGAVLVVVSSYPYALDWAAEHVPAVVWTSHAGQELGNAVAAVLTGRRNPSGRLPQTWYAGTADLPDPTDYDVIGSRWTYRYSRREHVYPFGHGLSYTTFDYGEPAASIEAEGPGALTVQVNLGVTNTGGVIGAEIVQIYARRKDGEGFDPEREAQAILVGFERVTLSPGERAEIRFQVEQQRLELWDEHRQAFRLPAGEYEFAVGRSSEDLPVRVKVQLP